MVGKNIGFSLQDTLNLIIFAPMEIDLEINSVNDYANDIGAPTYHPHVSVIHYDEVGEIRHTINLFNVYGIFLQKNFPDNLNYGIGHYEQETGIQPSFRVLTSPAAWTPTTISNTMPTKPSSLPRRRKRCSIA